MDTDTGASEPIPPDAPGSYGTDSAVTPDPEDPAVTDPTGTDDDPEDTDEEETEDDEPAVPEPSEGDGA